MEEDFEKEQPKTEEEIKISAIKEVARRNIIEAVNRYMKTRDPQEMIRVQELVDALDDAFVLHIGQKDGTPVCVTFNPRSKTPEVPGELLDNKAP